MSQEAKVHITKDIFLKMQIQDQVEYLNKRLQTGMRVPEIRKEIGIGEKKLQKIINENGYKYNQKNNRYESSSKVIYESSAEVNTIEVPGATGFMNIDNKLLLNIINELNDVKQMNTKVVEMYDWYEKQRNVIEPPQLIIEPRKNTSTTVKSYKIYCETEKEFQVLCKKYSHLKVQDLVSKALDEFIEKYK